MGPMDAGDGMPTKPCPECGADYNSPVAEAVRRYYDANNDADWVERVAEALAKLKEER